jgi:hypothetical protein
MSVELMISLGSMIAAGVAVIMAIWPAILARRLTARDEERWQAVSQRDVRPVEHRFGACVLLQDTHLHQSHAREVAEGREH